MTDATADRLTVKHASLHQAPIPSSPSTEAFVSLWSDLSRPDCAAENTENTDERPFPSALCDKNFPKLSPLREAIEARFESGWFSASCGQHPGAFNTSSKGKQPLNVPLSRVGAAAKSYCRIARRAFGSVPKDNNKQWATAVFRSPRNTAELAGLGWDLRRNSPESTVSFPGSSLLLDWKQTTQESGGRPRRK